MLDNALQNIDYSQNKADEAVRTHLLPLLPENTAMYAWETGYSFTSPDLQQQVNNLEHLKKLLITLPSPYHY